MSKSGDSKNTLYCSFCGKSQHEVRKLIAGPTVFICDECVELCMDIIREENKTSIVKSRDGVPTPREINQVLQATTGWRVARVPALIPFQTFFELLASKQFPVATFIRSPQELDYLQEPDIFHEVFGHCPLLTNPWFAEFTHTYGKLGLNASKEQRVYLARLYWLTIEFGLVDTSQGRRIYGGGILSSPKETLYCLSDTPEQLLFDPVEAMRTPYRIDILQPLYFVLPNLKRLFELAHQDIMAMVQQAMTMGLHAPKFAPKAA